MTYNGQRALERGQDTLGVHFPVGGAGQGARHQRRRCAGGGFGLGCCSGGGAEPGGLKLHQYANLYFHARNPMLFKRKDQAADLCVLRISTDVLKLDGVVISDSNAASDYVRFLHPSQWQLLDFDDIYAMDWRHPNDQIAYFRHSARKCAEALAPHRIPPSLILGAYVVSQAASVKLATLKFALPVTVDSVLFFQ